MELNIATVILLIFGSLFLISFFKKSIRKIASHAEDIVITNINESKKELVERSQEAYNDLVESCGEDFKTPQEIFDILTKKKHHNKTSNQGTK